MASVSNFTIPSINLPRVPFYVTDNQIIDAIEDRFDGEVHVDKCDAKECIDRNTGEKYNMFFIHFTPLMTDPLNNDLTQFIHHINVGNVLEFPYGTRINPKNKKLFFFKVRAFKPKVAALKASPAKVGKQARMSIEDMVSLEKPSRSSLKKAAKTASNAEAAAEESAESEESEEEEQAVDEDN